MKTNRQLKMKNLLIISLFYCTLASCQSTIEEFNILLGKFAECELPLDFMTIKIEKQNQTVLTETNCINLHCLIVFGIFFQRPYIKEF